MLKGAALLQPSRVLEAMVEQNAWEPLALFARDREAPTRERPEGGTVFPWQHFYGGQSRRLLDLFETLSLAYGLENRSVYYDKKFAQEWIHVMPWIKNQTPKILQKKYLQDRGIKIPA